MLVETEGSEEEDKENDKAEENTNESVLENKVSCYSFSNFVTVGPWLTRIER